MILLINGQQAAVKEGSTIEYNSENRLFNDRDDYSLNIELPLAGCPTNQKIFGQIRRKEQSINTLYFDAQLIAGSFKKSGAVVITSITDEMVKVQFLEKRSFQNFYPKFDDTYVDEINLPAIPRFYANGVSPSTVGNRPGWGNGSGLSDGSKTPEQAWSGDDYICLPWVNDYTGNIQNRADYNNSTGKWQWHTQKESDDDAEVVTALSCQVRLYTLVEMLCEALGYKLRAEEWRNSEYYYLYSFNCIPAAWGGGAWQQTLPHWSVNEFFNKLEKLMLCEFDIDHRNKTISFSWSNQNVIDAGSVELNRIIDEYTVTVSKEDESKYSPTANVGYTVQDHELWNIYSCYWFFHQRPSLKPKIYNDTNSLISAVSSWSAAGGINGRANDVDANAIYYVKDIDTYFVLYGVARIKTGDKGANGKDVYQTAYRLMPLNAFGNRIFDTDKWEEVEDIPFVPARIDDTTFADGSASVGDLVFVNCGSTDNVSASGSEYTYGRRPGATKVDPSALVQGFTIGNLKAGYNKKSKSSFNSIAVGFWYGDFNKFTPYLPHPFLDTFDIKSSWQLTGSRKKNVKSCFEVIQSGHNGSLRINNDKYGLGKIIAKAILIDPRKKYEFNFLSDELPDVRAIFYVRGKRYLCSQIKVEIDENGMSKKMHGTFYRITS